MFLIALALAAAEPPSPPPRPMRVEVTRDTISDDVNATATLQDGNAKLTLTCDPDDYRGVRVIFTSQHWLAGNSFFTGERPLLYRFDEEHPVRRIWIMRDRGARLSGRDRVTRFLRGLIDAERLLFRTRDIEDHPVDVTFRIVGARPAVEQLLGACGEQRMRRRLFGG
ncbi:MAG TPA: hypothetical protein VLK25_11435 [Allosphingosinicella sp.]|nr:hypothetical protein [Allosphingosinicella sp.]